uniref:Uncharacterized protein n=1 Tax=Oryza rufipogon TaxID=4529 RepID=A0A0E0PZ50_ORYRU
MIIIIYMFLLSSASNVPSNLSLSEAQDGAAAARVEVN